MKKLILSVFIFLATFASTPALIKAFEVPKQVRIGLETNLKDRSSITIANKNIIIGYEAGQGQTFYNCAELSTGNSFVITPVSNAYYIRIERFFESYEQAKNTAAIYDGYDYKGIPCLVDVNKWAVYFGGFESETAAIAYGTLIAQDKTFLTPNNRRTALSDNNIRILFDNPNYFAQIAEASGGVLSLSGKTYRGRVEFGRYSGGNLTAINVLSLNEYLYSVVPSEMPPSFHDEALKAQSVAARNYAATRIGFHKTSGYDLCDSTHCQVYNGASNEAESTTRAVKATENVLIYYAGKPIEAYFFSSSGGYTENVEDVWTQPIPYLRSVPEPNETTALQWTRTFTLSDITNLLIANGYNIGTAKSVTIGRVSSVGRVQELIITATNGTKSLYKEEIRTFFSKTGGVLLYSRMFTLSNAVNTTEPTNIYVSNGSEPILTQLNQTWAVNASGNAVPISQTSETVSVIGSAGVAEYPLISVVSSYIDTDLLTITGSGNGHGVGMSQHGANGMAKTGYSYDQILKWYYTGVEVR